MIEWVIENWGICLGVVSAALVLAGTIAKLTPTEKDDTIVATIKGWVDKLPTTLKK